LDGEYAQSAAVFVGVLERVSVNLFNAKSAKVQRCKGVSFIFFAFALMFLDDQNWGLAIRGRFFWAVFDGEEDSG